MARPRSELGTHGEIEATPQHKVDGKWRRIPAGANVRGAERWRARVYFRGFDGVSGEVSAHSATKRKAIEAAQQKLDYALSSGSVDLRHTTPLAVVASKWISQIERNDSGMSSTTVALYRSNVARYLLGERSPVKGLAIGQVNTPTRVLAYLQFVADTHGTATSRTAKTVLSNILNFALEAGAILTNAVRQVRPVQSEHPTATKRDTTRAFTREERAALLDFADLAAATTTVDPRALRKREAVADLCHFMAGTGVRIGEARGLRWEHVDLVAGFVRLHGTKSAAARRRLDLPPWLVKRLVERRARMIQHYLGGRANAKRTAMNTRAEVSAQLDVHAASVGVTGYVFPSPATLDPERQWDQSNSSNAMRSLLSDAGFPWATPHAFRRTAITWLGESGAPLAQIADFAGHSDPSMTASVYLARDFDGDKSGLAAVL